MSSLLISTTMLGLYITSISMAQVQETTRRPTEPPPVKKVDYRKWDIILACVFVGVILVAGIVTYFVVIRFFPYKEDLTFQANTAIPSTVKTKSSTSLCTAPAVESNLSDYLSDLDSELDFISSREKVGCRKKMDTSEKVGTSENVGSPDVNGSPKKGRSLDNVGTSEGLA
uniref:Equatorin n=1 Tax=Panagrellus redivivus TaxID=6233 RepID=A0A7E4V0H3_PANRE